MSTTTEARKQFLARLLQAALDELKVDGVYLVTAVLDPEGVAIEHVSVYSTGPAACCDEHIALVLATAGASVGGALPSALPTTRDVHNVVIDKTQ